QGDLGALQAAGLAGAEYVLGFDANDQRRLEGRAVQLGRQNIPASAKEPEFRMGLLDTAERVVEGQTFRRMGSGCSQHGRTQGGASRQSNRHDGSSECRLKGPAVPGGTQLTIGGRNGAGHCPAVAGCATSSRGTERAGVTFSTAISPVAIAAM